MGNGVTSDSSFGKIAIRLHKDRFVAGEQVEGEVLLDLAREFPASVVTLAITGRERVQIVESRMYRDPSRGGMASSSRKHVEEKEFFAHSFAIYETSGQSLEPGQFSFPFCFRLPEGLPGSFKFDFEKSGEEGFGVIEYEILAGLRSSDPPTTLFERTDLLVDQSQISIPAPLASELQENLEGYCYRKLGRIEMKCLLDKDLFLSGEEICIKVEADASKASVETLEFKASLIQITEISTTDGESKFFDSKVVAKGKVSGIQAGKILKGSEALSVILIPELTGYSKGQSTTEGSLVRNSYRVEIEGEVDACLCYQAQPKISTAVRIGRKTDSKKIDFENFEPKMMPPIVCAISESTKMNKEERKALDLDAELDYPRLSMS